MLKFTKEILKDCDYLIEYDFDGKNQAIIKCPFVDAGTIVIKWNPTIKSLVNTWTNEAIECPDYAAAIIAQFILQEICKYFKYPYHFVLFKLQNNNTTLFYFDVSKNIKKSKDLDDLSQDIMNNGVRPEHFLIAEQFEIGEGFKALVEYYLGIKLCTDK